MNKKRILIYGWFGERNIGDELILDASINLIKRNIPNAEINVMGTKPNICKATHKGVNRFSTYIDKRPKEILRTFKYGFTNVVKNILFNDVLVIASGGALSDWHNESTVTLFSLIDIFSFFKKPIYMLDVGAGPITREDSYIKFRKKLSKVELITVRDNSSYKELKKIGLNNVVLSRDVVYSYWESIRQMVQNIDTEQGSVGLVIASVCYETEDVYVEYKRQINELMKKLVEKGKKVYLIPFLYEEDKVLFSQLNIPNEVEILYDKDDLFSAIKYIAKVDVVISVRYHALVLGAILKKRIIPFVHHSKNGDFADDFDLLKYAEYIGDGKNWRRSQISANKIVTDIDKMLHDYEYFENIDDKLNKKINLSVPEKKMINNILLKK